jgi:hypothetical protein
MLRGKMGYIAGIDGQVFQRTCISMDKCNLTAHSKMVVVHLLSLSIPSHDIINCSRCGNRRQKREACTLRTMVFKR